MKKAIVETNGDIKVPVFYIDANLDPSEQTPKESAIAMTFKHTLLSKIFSPDELESLSVVKIKQGDDSEELSIDEEAALLKNREFPDGVRRAVAFSSGDNYFFTNKALKTAIHDFVKTEPDAACRYGSLFASDCFKGMTEVEGLRVKIVDFTNPEDAQYRTGDCHGAIASWLAAQVGAEPDTPFQFRLAWRQNWADDSAEKAPPSFLAKGTFLADDTLTDEQDYDIILDRSSIKGINKSLIEDAIPCGDYVLPHAVLGNRQNAEVIEYDNSWQFTVWFSEEAVLKDFKASTQQQASELATAQRDPTILARYIVDQYDKQKEFREEHRRQQLEGDADVGEDDSEAAEEESALIKILRSDRYGQVLDSPKIVADLERYVARQWRDLAVKSGFVHSSGMAQPAPELQQGVVCIPHLPEGDVVVTRYPIVTKDNIRIYHNTHQPELFHKEGEIRFHADNARLMQSKNVVWMNPDDAALYHQADFDGDQMVVTPASKMPHIAREIRRAGEPFEFEQITKRAKVPYADLKDYQTGKGLLNLPKVAVASRRNQVGRIANAIGRVQSAMPDEDSSEGFKTQKRQLLLRLAAGLQVEVDYPKSAERHEDVEEISGASLLKDAHKFSKRYPCPLFDRKNDSKAYADYPLPAQPQGSGSINAIAREYINPLWQAVRLPKRERSEFRHLLSKPERISEQKWQNYCEDAKEVEDKFREAVRELDSHSPEYPKAIGKVYQSFREQVEETYPTSAARDLFDRALWHVQHTRIDYDQVKECQQIAKKLPVTFHLDPMCQPPSEALPREAYVLSVPFDTGKPDDKVFKVKQSLDEHDIRHDAVVSRDYPMVDFILKPLSEQPNPEITQKLIEQQVKKHGDNAIEPEEVPKPKWIAAPPKYSAIAITPGSGKAALAYQLATDTLCQQLETCQVSQARLFGLQYNDFKDEPFTGKQWQQPVSLKVGKLKLDKKHPNYYTNHGQAVVMIEDKIIGTFAPDGAKLPIGTTFEATIDRQGNQCQLQINPETVQLPVMKGFAEQAKHSHQAVEETMMNRSQPSQEQQCRESTEILMKSIREYEATQEVYGYERIPGTKWLFIIGDNRDVKVRDNELITFPIISRFNLDTGQISKLLSPENAKKFIESAKDHHAKKSQPKQVASELRDFSQQSTQVTRKQQTQTD